MDDANPSATPMPAQPVATVTSNQAPFPPADPLPHGVAPSVTDPVSNLDFPPADDAFALELRAQSIEQLAGVDALRRGESERIEAGRSATNADLVAGRDRVRVQDTLHEHTGHGLAEQATHLHTTVEGVLDVHAASEDTVLLAGHMRDLWDGGAAIVAAMTDDTVAGGGIRVTTPLDLWVHGLMGVEERIGTCTADAVLLEGSATHYEREYGPGAHAAGLAVYAGSLYQSSRTTFRPLMRVSSGVRNLIAGDGGGGASGDAGAGGAPGASPPPVPAQTGAAEASVTGTLAAGRRAVEAPATAPGSADALTDARRAPLEALEGSVDARVAEETGEAGTVMHAEDLPELTRSAHTAEQLGALQETLRIDGAEAGSDTASALRTSELEGAVSTHPVSGGGGPLEITPPSAVCGKNAPMVRPHPDAPWGQGPQMHLGLRGGADRPPQSAATKSDFLAANRRMRDLHRHYNRLSDTDIVRDFHNAIHRLSRRVERQFKSFGGNTKELPKRAFGITQADQAYIALQETAHQAERDRDLIRARAIRETLDAIDRNAVEELQALTTKYGIPEAPSAQAMQRPPASAKPTVTVAAIPPPAHTPTQFDWVTAYRQLHNLVQHLSGAGMEITHMDFRESFDRASNSVRYRFRKFGGNFQLLPPISSGATKLEHAYRAIEDMARRAAVSDSAARACELRQALESINRTLSEELDDLTIRYGALDALSTRITRGARPTQATQAMEAMLLPPMQLPSVTVPSTTVPSAGRLDIPVPAPPFALAVNPAFPNPAGDLGRGTLDPPATVSGATAAHPAAPETIVTPSLGGASSFWLQPVDPAPAPLSAPGRAAPGAGAPLPATDPWRIRPPGMGGEPHPVAFDPWSTAPGPSSRILSTETIRTPVPSAGAPPGWQDAATPGFVRAAAGAVEFPFPHREAIARLDANLTLRTGGAGALGWSATRWRAVLDDLYRINAIARSITPATAHIDWSPMIAELDWSSIETLMRILHAPPPSP